MVALAAAALLAVPTLPATPRPNSIDTMPCPKKPASTLDYEACAARELIALGRRFNRLSHTLWPLLDADARASFVHAHRAWLAYRRNECELEASRFRGGTLAGVVLANCEADLTRVRVAKLARTVASFRTR